MLPAPRPASGAAPVAAVWGWLALENSRRSPFSRGHVSLPLRRARPAKHKTNPRNKFSDLGTRTKQGRREPQTYLRKPSWQLLSYGAVRNRPSPPSVPHAARGSPNRGSRARRPSTQRLGKSYFPHLPALSAFPRMLELHHEVGSSVFGERSIGSLLQIQSPRWRIARVHFIQAESNSPIIVRLGFPLALQLDYPFRVRLLCWLHLICVRLVPPPRRACPRPALTAPSKQSAAPSGACGPRSAAGAESERPAHDAGRLGAWVGGGGGISLICLGFFEYWGAGVVVLPPPLNLTSLSCFFQRDAKYRTENCQISAF